MSEQTITKETSTRDTLSNRIIAQINEERLVNSLTSIQLSKIKLLDDLAQEIIDGSDNADVIALIDENLKENPGSLVSHYISGIISLHSSNRDGLSHLKVLIDDFSKFAKWTLVDHIADRILEVDDSNRMALRAKTECVERLKGKKEVRPYLEKLAEIDTANPDVQKKFGLMIHGENPERAIKYLKEAAKAYARIKDYKNIDEIWPMIVDHAYSDFDFFEKIERTLIANREKLRMAGYLLNLSEPHKLEENWPAVIKILKKVLEYEPISLKARTDIVRAYKALYANHSLLGEFLKMSELTNNKKAIGQCIASFERNIVFDKDNFVYHRTRGVGKITQIDEEQMVIDFRDNPGQKMTIQMAISSLLPLEPDHIWVRYYINPEEMHTLFKENLPGFFVIFLKSFNYAASLAEIKAEITPRYLPPDQWSKWWSRVRTQLNKDKNFGFNPRKKDELILRKEQMSNQAELQMKFEAESDWHKKLDFALKIIKPEEKKGEESLDPLDIAEALNTCVQYYRDQESNRDTLKRLHSFLFIEAVNSINSDDPVLHEMNPAEFHAIIMAESAKKMTDYIKETQAVDFKKDLVNLVIKSRPDYPEILAEVLFEVPPKINKFVIQELDRLKQFDTLKNFMKKALSKYREHPEIFLWFAKNTLTRQLKYDEWNKLSKEEIALLIFRLLKPLSTIEKKGTKLKNDAMEALFGTTNITVDNIKKGTFPEIIENADPYSIRKMAALFKEVTYIPDAHKENFLAYLLEARPDFNAAQVAETESAAASAGFDVASLFPDERTILSTADGLAKRKEHLNHLINVEMPENSNDIGHAQEKGDLRENAEYKAAMERQSTLRAEITTLDDEIKRAQIIDPDSVRTDIVTIGCRIKLLTPDNEVKDFSLFGPWEADPEKNIISYVSPLGRTLIGKKKGDKAKLESNITYTIQAIENALI
jgi:transcription elongation factor GreA